MLPPTEQQSTAQLLRRVVNGLNGIIDRQIEMAKLEVKENLFELFGASKTLGIGAGIGIVGALMLLNVLVLVIVLGLNEISAWWLGGPWLGWVVMLLILIGVFVATYLIVKRGLREVQVSPLGRTRETLRENTDWAQHLLTRNGR
jgi:uncharacterized membrane protein YqjE